MFIAYVKSRPQYNLLAPGITHTNLSVRRQLLKPADLPRRMTFCTWILTLTDQQLLAFLFSDEANFQLCGHVNSHNVRRYAPLKTSDPVNGGRPGHFTVEKPTFSPKIMVFCGVRYISTSDNWIVTT